MREDQAPVDTDAHVRRCAVGHYAEGHDDVPETAD